MLEWWTCRKCQIPNDDAYSICMTCGYSRSRSASPPAPRARTPLGPSSAALPSAAVRERKREQISPSPRSSYSHSALGLEVLDQRLSKRFNSVAAKLEKEEVTSAGVKRQAAVTSYESPSSQQSNVGVGGSSLKYSNGASARMVGLADRLLAKLQPSEVESSNAAADSSASRLRFSADGSKFQISAISKFSVPQNQQTAGGQSTVVPESPGTSPWRRAPNASFDRLARERSMSQRVDEEIASVAARVATFGRMGGSVESALQDRTLMTSPPGGAPHVSPIPVGGSFIRGSPSVFHNSAARAELSFPHLLHHHPALSAQNGSGSTSEEALLRRQLVESRLELLAATDDRDRVLAELTQRCVTAQAQADKWRLEALAAKDEVVRAGAAGEEREAALRKEIEALRSQKSSLGEVAAVAEEDFMTRVASALETRGAALSMLANALRILVDETGPLAEGKRFSVSVESFALARSTAVTELKEQIHALEARLAASLEESERLRKENQALQHGVADLSGHVQLQSLIASAREHKLQCEVQLLRHHDKTTSSSAAVSCESSTQPSVSLV
jgi:hypothetical protein